MTRKNCLEEVFGRGYDMAYRWFRFREFIGLPSYAKEDKRKRKFNAILFLVGKTLS